MSIPDLKTFGFSEDYQAVYDLAYRYSREELYPLCGKMDDEEWFPEDAFRTLGDQGLLGVTIPEEYGGSGLDVLAQCFICEAVAYWNHSLSASLLASDNLCVHNLVKNASALQKAEYLPRFCDGSAIGALGMTCQNIDTYIKRISERINFDTIHKHVLLGSAHILRHVLTDPLR